MSLAYNVRSFTTNVTTAGTAVPLEANSGKFPCEVLIKARSTNTQAVYVGDSTVTSATGFSLTSGQSVSIGNLSEGMARVMFDLSNIWINATVNGEGVQVLCSSSFIRND